MKQFPIDLMPYLSRGLRRDQKLIEPALMDCYGCVPTKEGLRHYTPITNPAASFTFNWPFPQLFFGKTYSLVALESSIEALSSSSVHAVYPLYSLTSPSSSATIQGSGAWHFMDFGDTWVLMNGTDVVIRSNKGGIIGDSNKVLVYNDNAVGTGCALEGRGVFGGFSTSILWSEDWNAIFDSYVTSLDIPFEVNHSARSNFVYWTGVGAGDLLWMFLPDIAVRGYHEKSGYSASMPMIVDALERNDLGIMPMPWAGQVYCIKRLGKDAIVYGDHGIARLFPVVDPAPTLGIEVLANFGIPSRSCVGGNESVHAFVDYDGYIWMLSAQGMERIGFREYIQPLIDGPLMISFDPHLGEFYFSSSQNCYVLAPGGLGEATEVVTSLAYREEGLIGITSPFTDQSFRLETVDLAFGYSGIKEGKQIHLDYDGITSLSMGFSGRYAKNGTFTTPSLVPANSEGVSFQTLAGEGLRAIISGTANSDFSIREGKAYFSVPDRTYARGIR